MTHGFEDADERRQQRRNADRDGTLAVVRVVVTYAAPVSAAQMLQFAINLISVASCAALGSLALSGASLAISLFNAVAYATVVGLGGALDTILAQIYGNEARDPLYGTVVLRMFYILMIASVPIAAVMSHIDVVLLAVGMAPEVVLPTVTYARAQMFGLPSLIIFELLRRYFQCQGVTKPFTVCQIAALAVHAVVQPFAVRWFGLAGSAVAWVLLITCCDIALLFYIRTRWEFFSATFPKLERRSLDGWGAVFREGVAAFGMTVAEWAAFEVSNASSGLLGVVDLAAFSIVLQCVTLCYGVCSGLVYGSAFFVGQQVGAGTPLEARKFAVVILMLNIVVACCDSSVLIIWGARIAALFSDDPAVIARSVTVFRVAAVFHLFDSTQSCCIGITKGIGLQRIGAAIMCFTWIVVGVPLNLFFAFYLGLGAPGLFLGMVVATITISIPSFITTVFLRRDWATITKVAAASDVPSDIIR